MKAAVIDGVEKLAVVKAIKEEIRFFCTRHIQRVIACSRFSNNRRPMKRASEGNKRFSLSRSLAFSFAPVKRANVYLIPEEELMCMLMPVSSSEYFTHSTF